MSQNIGLLNEKPLHAALKEWYAQPEDRFEVSVDGFVIDVVQGNEQGCWNRIPFLHNE